MFRELCTSQGENGFSFLCPCSHPRLICLLIAPLYFSQDTNMITAVLDVSSNELHFPSVHSPSLHSLCLPDADILASRMSAYSPHSARIAAAKPLSGGSCVRSKGLYSLTSQQKDTVKAMQGVIASHIAAIAGLAVDLDAAQKERGGEPAAATDGGRSADRMASSDLAEEEEEVEEKFTSESLLAVYSNEVLESDSEQRMSSSARSLTRSVVSGFSAQLGVPEESRAAPMINLNGELFADSDEDLFMDRFRKTQVRESSRWFH